MPAVSLQAPLRGLVHARGVIHLHSPLSHDACDGKGFENNVMNATCLARLRAAICDDRLDFAMLTDHKTHFGFRPFSETLLIDSAAGDLPVMKDGAPIANQMKCPDGHSALLMVGHEDRLMPVGLEKHAVDQQGSDANERFYAREDLDQAMTYRQLGAKVIIPHTESRPIETLRTLAPALSAIEIFNLHALMDGRIRSEFLGLDMAGAVRAMAGFTQDTGTEPDLAMLPAFQENGNDLGKWATLTSEGFKLGGVAGCDAHENVALPLPDGDRIDAYRRMIRWATTHVLAADLTPAGIKGAIEAGRTLVIIEVFGTPVGFDFHAERAGAITEMGGETQVGAVVSVTAPTVDGAKEQPPRTLILWRATATGWVEVARGAGPFSFTTTEAGAYRAEVLINPTHLTPYLGKQPEQYLRDVTWIYGSPLYVK